MPHAAFACRGQSLFKVLFIVVCGGERVFSKECCLSLRRINLFSTRCGLLIAGAGLFQRSAPCGKKSPFSTLCTSGMRRKTVSAQGPPVYEARLCFRILCSRHAEQSSVQRSGPRCMKDSICSTLWGPRSPSGDRAARAAQVEFTSAVSKARSVQAPHPVQRVLRKRAFAPLGRRKGHRRNLFPP